MKGTMNGSSLGVKNGLAGKKWGSGKSGSPGGSSSRSQLPKGVGEGGSRKSSMSDACVGGAEMDELTEEERRALRASRFADASHAARPSPGGASSAGHEAQTGTRQHPSGHASRMAHPGGPISTNKAAALMRFLQRKLNSGVAGALDPRLVEQAVRNAQQSLNAPSEIIKNVESFKDDDGDDNAQDEDDSGDDPGHKRAHAAFHGNKSGRRGKKELKKERKRLKDKKRTNNMLDDFRPRKKSKHK